MIIVLCNNVNEYQDSVSNGWGDGEGIECHASGEGNIDGSGHGRGWAYIHEALSASRRRK